MNLPDVYQQLIEGIVATRWQEYVAGSFGIVSVLYSRKENILVYPTGLISTILYAYFCVYWWQLYAEGSLNIYYTVMSIYGWILWAKQKKGTSQKTLEITFSTKKEWKIAGAFFVFCWIILYFILKQYTKSTVPFADAFTSAAAYTGMWLMAKKKIENWLWWILTDFASIPLYFYKHAVFTSFQFLIFFILAIMGYISWKKKLQQNAA